MLTLNNVTKIYNTNAGEVTALHGVSLSLPNTGMICVVGKSGAGKTTLLNILAGIDSPTSGYLSYNSERIDIDGIERYRAGSNGIIFQDANLLKNLTVYENIRLAAEIGGNKDCNIEELLIVVGLAGYGKRMANELSSGQAQRVSIARAMAKGTKIILADEPTGNFGSGHAAQIFDILKVLSDKILVVAVTHDGDIAKKYANDIVEINDGIIVDSTIGAVVESEVVVKCARAKDLGKLRVRTKVSMFKWVYDKVGFKTVVLSLISIFMLVFTMTAAGLYTSSYSQSLNGKLAEGNDFLVVNENETLLNNNDINAIKNELGKSIDYGVGISVDTIPFYNPNKSAINNQRVDNSLYYRDRCNIDSIMGVNDSSHYDMYEGRLPEAAWEICLPSIFADSILEYGAYPLQKKKLFGVPANQYTPNDVVTISSVEELIGKEIIIKNKSNENNAKFKIVGFYHSSTNKYKWLRDIADINAESDQEKARIEANVNALNSMKQIGMGLVSEAFLQEFISGEGDLDFAVSQTQYINYAGQSYVMRGDSAVESVEYAQGKSADNASKYDIVIPRAIAEANGLVFGSSVAMGLNRGNSIDKTDFNVIGYHDSDVLISKALIDEISGGDKRQVYNTFVFKDSNSKEYKAFHKYVTKTMNIEENALEYSTASSYRLDDVMRTFDEIRYYVFLPLILVAFALTVLFVSALVSDFAAVKTKNIGTLRSLGLRKREVYQIFILAVGWQLIFEVILAFIIGGVAFGVMNSVLANAIGIFADVLFLNVGTILATLLAVLAIIPLGIVLPIWYKNRKTPQNLMNK